MFWIGSRLSVTPNRVAVAGISCISPCAPAPDTASARPPLSADITANTSAGDTAVPSVAFNNSVPYLSAISCICCRRGAATLLPPGPCDSVAIASGNRPCTALWATGTVSQNQS